MALEIWLEIYTTDGYQAHFQNKIRKFTRKEPTMAENMEQKVLVDNLKDADGNPVEIQEIVYTQSPEDVDDQPEQSIA